MKLFSQIFSKVNLEKPVFAILFKSKFGWSKFAPKMLQVFFPQNLKFCLRKFSFSPDPVILDLKLQLANLYVDAFDKTFPKLIAAASENALFDKNFVLCLIPKKEHEKCHKKCLVISQLKRFL